MEEVQEMISPEVQSDWSNRVDDIISVSKDVDTDMLIEKADQTKDVFVDEAKNLAPNVVGVVKESVQRLDAAKRPISFVPNSLLFYGGLSALAIYIAKKL